MDYHLFPILQRFERLTWKSGNPYLGECKCPAHDDSTNSLHITIKVDELGSPKLLLKCHAGCTATEICSKFGETTAALFPDRTLSRRNGNSPSGSPSSSAGKRVGPSGPAAERKLVKVYDYHDANGEILHQTLRWEPKHFTQRRKAEPGKIYQIGGTEYRSFKDPFGNWWINTLKGIEPVIYRLPQLLKINPAKVIFLCEGEKDADNLMAAFPGLFATTVPMGAGKWRASYTKALAGRRVIIIPDTDKPRTGQTDPAANAGYDGARKIASELVAVCHEVRICYLPNLFDLKPKWDLTDWLKAGGTKPQFIQACNDAEILGIGHPGLIPAGMTASDLRPESGENGAAVAEILDSESSAGTTSLTTLPAVTPPPRPISTIIYRNPVLGKICNYIQTSESIEGLPMRETVQNFLAATHNWPKRVGRSLFFVDEHNSIDPNFFPVRWIDSPAHLFGWAGGHTGHVVSWANLGGCCSKDEFFAELRNRVEEYESVDRYPHEPRVPGVYYACKAESEWVSTRPGCLYELISRFSPAEPVDYDLIIAFMCTMVWGGGGGQRPMFLITSDAGRGSGKTTMAGILSSIVGGSIALTGQFDDQIAKQRLLSPDGREKRCCILDNLKSHRFSSADVEALITSETISGKQLYVGEASRANRITYVMTMNGPSLSTDMAQRSVVIKIGAAVHAEEWLDDITSFISQHRVSIISELLEILKQPSKKLHSYGRWANWEKHVLSKVPNAEICQEMIGMRQRDIDAEQDESGLIIEHFERQLLRNNVRTDYDKVLISSETAAIWLNKAMNERHANVTAGRILNQKIKEGRLKGIEYCANPRGYYWVPAGWKEGGPVLKPGRLETFDVEDFVNF